MSFTPVAVSPRKVRILFGAPMEVNAALTTPGSYSVTTQQGISIQILQVIPEGPPATPRAVSLILRADLTARGVHTARLLDPAVRFSNASPVTPVVANFRWDPRMLTVRVPMRDFSGETRAGLLGQHHGLVFFSPGLTQAAPNSAIQVDEVSVCTRATDVYRFPNPPDPPPLFTFQAGKDCGTLSSGRVCFARFEKLTGVRMDTLDSHRDALPQVTDSHCIAVLEELLDPALTPRLNAVHYATPKTPVWPIFDGVSATPFATASNLAPIGPGATTTVILQP